MTVCNGKVIDNAQRRSKSDIRELKDAKRPGCLGAPRRCHGDYLEKRIEELLSGEVRT